MLQIKKMELDEEIQSCFNVMSQLRPQIKENEFISRIHLQMKSGYQLVAALSNGEVAAIAGFHLHENLAWNKYLYIEDLVVDENKRSSGFGKKLLSWLHNEAEKNKCVQLHLDSGIQRKNAHRFYEREGMTFTSHHYVSQL